jgi:hypothetical protein
MFWFRSENWLRYRNVSASVLVSLTLLIHTDNVQCFGSGTGLAPWFNWVYEYESWLGIRSVFNPKIVTKLSEICIEMFIADPSFSPSRIKGSNKALVPGSVTPVLFNYLVTKVGSGSFINYTGGKNDCKYSQECKYSHSRQYFKATLFMVTRYGYMTISQKWEDSPDLAWRYGPQHWTRPDTVAYGTRIQVGSE